LKKARFVNPKIEEELVEFKIEIADKFQASQMNKTYIFPLLREEPRKQFVARSYESSLQPTMRQSSLVR
jgi:hypothetical protein